MARYYGVPLRNGLPIGLGSAISLRKPGGAPAAVPDPYFEYTTLLLPGNGTNGAQNNTFLDSSTNAFSITRNGNTTQGTFSPFSQTGWGNYFDGTGDYLTVASGASPSGTRTFTVEFWIYPLPIASGYRLILANGTGGGFAVLIQSAGTISYGRALVAVDGTTTGAVSFNQWNHVALVRSGTGSNQFVVYINGTSAGTFTNSTNYSAGTAYIGIDGNGIDFPVNAYLSNVRVTNTAVYTGNFTPSTTPLTAISGTSLLTCQSNRFIDNSTNNFAITRNGDVSVQAFSPFNPTAAWSAATNGGSGYFDGSGDYLNCGTNAALGFGTGNFTVEAWIYRTATGNFPIYTNGPQAAGSFGFYLLSENLRCDYYFGTGLQGVTTVPINTWCHVAVIRSGSTLSLYLNGNRDATTTTSDNNTSSNGIIGRAWTDSTSSPTGYMSGVRVVKGTALYTGATYTVPTAPLTAISGTSLLTNFTNAGIYDATSKNDLETVGNAQISTTQSKFGGSSMYFDGVGDWLIMPTGPNLVLGTGDFTIECWLRPGSQVGSNNSFVGSNASGGPILNLIGSGTSTSIAFNAYGSANIFNISYTFTQNTWVHVAVSRSGTNLRLFINGTQTGSTVTDSTNFSGFLRTVGMADNGNQIYVGYMQDLRVTKGYARYTSNFTPPTTAFPLL